MDDIICSGISVIPGDGNMSGYEALHGEQRRYDFYTRKVYRIGFTQTFPLIITESYLE